MNIEEEQELYEQIKDRLKDDRVVEYEGDSLFDLMKGSHSVIRGDKEE